MDGDELRQRIKALGWGVAEAAEKLGMSVPGLQHNLRDERPIRRQTELLLDALEHLHNAATKRSRRGKTSANLLMVSRDDHGAFAGGTVPGPDQPPPRAPRGRRISVDHER